MPVDGPLKKRTAVRTRRYVQDHRYAGLTGSISQPVTEFTYNRKRQTQPPPPPACWGIEKFNADACHRGTGCRATTVRTKSSSVTLP